MIQVKSLHLVKERCAWRMCSDNGSKTALRLEMAAVRSSLGSESRLNQSEAACRRAEAEILAPARAGRRPEGQPGNLTIFTYLSFRDELSTQNLIRNCLSAGDTVLVPKVSADRRLTLHALTGVTDIQPAGKWQIPEPVSSPVWPVSRYPEIDVIVVPGLAYDKQGGRLGYGGGYYDRFAEELVRVCKSAPKPLFCSLLFEEQLVEKVPAEPHDLQLDVLITASNVIYINQDC